MNELLTELVKHKMYCRHTFSYFPIVHLLTKMSNGDTLIIIYLKIEAQDKRTKERRVKVSISIKKQNKKRPSVTVSSA